MSDLLSHFNIQWQDALSKGIKIVIVLIFMLVAIKFTKRLFKKAAKKAEDIGKDPGYLLFFRYAVTGIIYFLCIATIVSEIPGLEKFVTTLLAGSGIAAVVIGMASQEAAGNIVSGVLILAFKPFKIGDTVRYLSTDTTGTVEEIGFRHTVIRTAQNKRLLIPNSLMNSNIVENANYGEDEVLFAIELGLTYDSDIKKAMKILAEEVSENPDFIDKRNQEEIEAGVPKVNVTIKNFADYSIIIQCSIWAKNTAKSVQMKSDILLSVRDHFNEAGIQFAFPTVTVYRPIEVASKDAEDAGN